MAKLGIIKNFRATHGSKPHEHNFKLEIILKDKIIGDFVGNVDFHDVSKIIDEELSKLENKYLNEYLNIRATVENIGVYLLKKLSNRNINNLYSIKIYEEADRFVEIYYDEL